MKKKTEPLNRALRSSSAFRSNEAEAAIRSCSASKRGTLPASLSLHRIPSEVRIMRVMVNVALVLFVTKAASCFV